MKRTNRFIALALCCTLTLGAFAYRPPAAKAIAVVDDAVVIGALLLAFAAGCGLIFSNNGMTSSEIASAMTAKWNEFNEAAENTASSFAAWLGFEDTSALLDALSFSGSKLVIPRAVARKFADFTRWFVKKYSSASIEQPSIIKKYGPSVSLGGSTYALQNMDVSIDTVTGDVLPKPTQFGVTYAYPLGANGYYLSIYAYGDEELWNQGKRQNYSVDLCDSDGNALVTGAWDISMDAYLGYTQYSDYVYLVWGYNGQWRNSKLQRVTWADVFSSPLAKDGAEFGVTQVPGDDTIDLPDGDSAIDVTTTGVNASSVEDMLQQILDKLAVNELATDVAASGTQTGDNTGDKTDEDGKPYLPYIPRIFEKLETLPQDIADKVKGLFVPDEAFVDALPAQIADIFDNRCGLLTYPASLMADFLTRLSTLTVQEPVFSWGNINEPFSGRQIIAAGSYNLNSAIQSDAMKTVYDTYIIVVKAMIALWFVELCRKKYNQIIRS